MPPRARLAINGFGRIGRLILRAHIENPAHPFDIVAINELATPETNAHLMNHDSVHGRLPQKAALDGDALVVGDTRARLLRVAEPAALPWGDMGVDVVLECTGRFTTRASAAQHLAAGAKKVLISAPAADDDYTAVFGVNHAGLLPSHTVVSNGSCTTNCLVPVVVTLHDAFGIVHGFMTTVHSYTSDQRLHDSAHDDLQRARAAALNMIPTSTGAAKAVFKVLPELKGKLDGVAIRVPTPNVSLVDLTVVVSRSTTAEQVNAALSAAASGPLKGVLAVTSQPLVSGDFNHDPHSAIVALGETKVVDGTFVRVLAWYDNEWGFSNRMLDVAALMAVA